jgi:hypothetical protein
MVAVRNALASGANKTTAGERMGGRSGTRAATSPQTTATPSAATAAEVWRRAPDPPGRTRRGEWCSAWEPIATTSRSDAAERCCASWKSTPAWRYTGSRSVRRRRAPRKRAWEPGACRRDSQRDRRAHDTTAKRSPRAARRREYSPRVAAGERRVARVPARPKIDTASVAARSEHAPGGASDA